MKRVSSQPRSPVPRTLTNDFSRRQPPQLCLSDLRIVPRLSFLRTKASDVMVALVKSEGGSWMKMLLNPGLAVERRMPRSPVLKSPHVYPYRSVVIVCILMTAYSTVPVEMW